MQLRVVMAQLDFLVGDIDGNATLIAQAIERAEQEMQADVIVFPELAISGYPPEDLLLRPSLNLRVTKALARIQAHVGNIWAVIGYPRSVEREGKGRLFNAAGIMHKGEIVAEYHKQCLPNYQVFDEKRYFEAGDESCVVKMRGVPVGITICEDLWEEHPANNVRDAGAHLLLNLNASPFHKDKLQQRQALVSQRAKESGMTIVYVNLVGGQDELVFDGGSMVADSHGELRVLRPCFEEELYPLNLLYKPESESCEVLESNICPALTQEQSVYRALVLGVRDYVNKNGFKGVVLGLSGGIDSALTLAVACDALGPERVEAVMMPFRYTAQMSVEDAEAEATALGVKFQIISIEKIYESFAEALSEEFAGLPIDVTEQNIQARCRGVLLMAISNKKGVLVLTTGNKSEMAVGYSTLYGDMAGGFDVLKDVPKMLVYQLSRYRNTLSPVIPERVIERPPSAELAPDQKDEDNLPPYEILDQILECYVERDMSADAIIAAGFDSDAVHKVIRLVDINEYKRRQAPVGVRITQRGFGKDRRYPITSGWKAGE